MFFSSPSRTTRLSWTIILQDPFLPPPYTKAPYLPPLASIHFLCHMYINTEASCMGWVIGAKDLDSSSYVQEEFHQVQFY